MSDIFMVYSISIPTGAIEGQADSFADKVNISHFNTNRCD